MAYPALAPANYFIDKANMVGKALDHLKIQKLVYMAHGWHLAIFDDKLIDEPIQAWKYGPVIPSLYHTFKQHGNGPIIENGVMMRKDGTVSVPSIAYHDDDTRRLLDKVWQAYSKYSGVQLSNLTHLAETPWHQTWNAAGGRKNTQIKDQMIADHFRGLARHD